MQLGINGIKGDGCFKTQIFSSITRARIVLTKNKEGVVTDKEVVYEEPDDLPISEPIEELSLLKSMKNDCSAGNGWKRKLNKI
jgi:hypothetical protein